MANMASLRVHQRPFDPGGGAEVSEAAVAESSSDFGSDPAPETTLNLQLGVPEQADLQTSEEGKREQPDCISFGSGRRDGNIGRSGVR